MELEVDNGELVGAFVGLEVIVCECEGEEAVDADGEMEDCPPQLDKITTKPIRKAQAIEGIMNLFCLSIGNNYYIVFFDANMQ